MVEYANKRFILFWYSATIEAKATELNPENRRNTKSVIKLEGKTTVLNLMRKLNMISLGINENKAVTFKTAPS